MKVNKLVNLLEVRFVKKSNNSYIYYEFPVPSIGKGYKCRIQVSRHKPNFSKELDSWVNKKIHSTKFAAYYYDLIEEIFEDLAWGRTQHKSFTVHEMLLWVSISDADGHEKDNYVHIYNLDEITGERPNMWTINSVDKDSVNAVYKFLIIQLKATDIKPPSITTKPKVDID